MRATLLVPLILWLGCQQQNTGTRVDSAITSDRAAAAPSTRIVVADSLREIRDDLYISRGGTLFFRVDDMSAMDINNPGATVPLDRFLTHIGNLQEPDSWRLDRIIDTASFKALASEYYIDSHRVYYHWTMSSGGFLSPLKAADPSTFRVFGNTNYAADKRHVCYRGRKVGMADPDTFEPIYTNTKGVSLHWYGRDVSRYFMEDDTISETQLRKEGIIR